MKNLIFIILIGFCINSCTKTPGLEDRINPLDPEGDNWYPPVVMVDKDTVYGEAKDFTTVSVTMFDYNSKIVGLEWSLDNDSTIEIDSVKKFNDSTIMFDTLVDVDTSGYDTVVVYDTSDYKTSLIDVDLAKNNDTVTFVMFSIDTVNSDTLKDTITFIEDSDTIYIKNMVDSLIDVSKIVTSNGIIPIIDTINKVTIDAVYYNFSTQFVFESPDTLQLFVKAIDSDGLESKDKDSVVVIITDSQ